MGKKYFAFISYKREDEEWAKWFQNELENYHLPSTLNGKTDFVNELPEQFRPPKGFRPVFRDIDELKAGNLPEQIYKALEDSLNLVVICSSKLADDENAKWVNKEISDFIEIGLKVGVDNVRRIFPFIIDGIPHAGDSRDCFPKVLRELSKEQERIGGNVNEGDDVSEVNRERAFVKVLAGMLSNVDFDELWNRYNRDKMERERREKEEKDKLQIAQSRFLAEKANQLTSEGDSYTARLLLLEALPKDLDNPDRPYVAEADAAIRYAHQNNSAVLQGHWDEVNSAVFNNDGKLLVTASEDHTIRIWDVLNGRQLKTIEQTKPVKFATFSPDGKKIASASDDNIVRIWNVNDGELYSSLEHDSNICHVDFNPKANRIVTVSYENIHVWDTAQRKCILKIHHDKHYNSLASYSPDGMLIVSVSPFSDTIIIWNAETGKCERIIKNHSTPHSASFSPNGCYIVTTSLDGVVRIWEVATGKKIISWETGTNPFIKSHAEYSPDGLSIVTALEDSSVRIWEAHTGKLLRSMDGHVSDVNYCKFNFDGTRIVSASKDKTIRLWELKANGLRNDISLPFSHVSYIDFNLSQKFAIASSKNEIIVLDIESGQLMNKFYVQNSIIRSIAFSPDGTQLLATSVKVITTPQKRWMRKRNERRIMNRLSKEYPVDVISCASNSYDSFLTWYINNRGSIYVWNLLTGDLSFVLNDKFPVATSFSPDCMRIVSAFEDNSALVLDSQTGTLLFTLEGHTAPIYSVIFSLDNKMIASGSKDCTIRIWDATNGSTILTMKGHTDSVKSLAFSPNGRLLASVSDDATFRLWDIETGKILWLRDGYYDLVTFSPDGKNLALVSNDFKIYLCDVYSGKVQVVLSGHTNSINSVSYYWKKGLMLSTSKDTTIRIWDIKTGYCLQTIKESHTDYSTAVFSKDGNRVIYNTDDGHIKTWYFPSLQDLINNTHKRFENNSLTEEEKKRYYLE